MPTKPRIDPYGFVPLGPKPPTRRAPLGHHRLDENGVHGVLVCRLTTKTPLFVYDPRYAKALPNGHEEARFPVDNEIKEAVIPGSSLKGVIRSLLEAVEPSCFALPNDWTNGERTYRGSGITRDRPPIKVRLSAGFETCSDDQRLCPACRIFGAVGRRGEWAWTGSVSISDARSPRGQYKLLSLATLGVLSTPKPEGRPREYLIQPGDLVKGRKFYRHRLDPPEPTTRRDRQTKTVERVDRGAVFHFTVEYENLRDDELRPLLYAIVLEPALWHKVGMGKPLGLGSAQIEIERWTKRNLAARYRGRTNGFEVVEDDALIPEINAWVRPYRESAGRPDEPPNLQALRKILRHQHGYDVSYPQPNVRRRAW